jgi:hypothetical protein
MLCQIQKGRLFKIQKMKLFKWIEGRQVHAHYHKFCFLYFKIFNIGIDGYLLRYQKHTILPIHKDQIEGSHYRLNIKIKGKAKFWCPSTIFRLGDKITLFRPDLFYHTLKCETKTYKISLGLAIFNKKPRHGIQIS